MADSDEENTFIKLGTPLEEIDEDEPRKKPVSMQEIQAKDTKGRPRFHGAFTGGFSAGYFNTVGSKEGWTPSTFVSSRSKKAEGEFSQRPEDFMDDDDLSEHGIAPRKLVTSGQFTSEERKRRRLDEARAATQDAAIPGVPALVDLIVPEKLSIGVKLLRKMGWKEGQGLGPRLSKKQRKLQKAGKKIYGCALPPSSSDEDDIDDSAVLKDVTYAPRDITPIHLLARDNNHGLGYSGLNPKSALPSTHINLFEPPAITKTGRKGIRGQAFGVGALEDEDDDIYSTDHMSNYDVTMEIEGDGNYGWTAPKNRGAGQTPVGYVGKMLEGFKLSSTPLVQKKHFPPPTLPRNFRPVHVFKKQEVENQSIGWFPGPDRSKPHFRKPEDTENQSGQGPLASAREKPQFTDAVSRGVALGEQPFVGTVFDLIPKEDRKRMEEAKQLKPGTKPSNETGEPVTKQPSLHQEIRQPVQQNQEAVCAFDKKPPVSSSQELFSSLGNKQPVRSQSSQEPAIASVEEQRRNSVPIFQGGAGFKPFMRNPEKQERYEKYLALVKQGHKDPYSALIIPGQTEWEAEKEREEFARAAKLYKPLSDPYSALIIPGQTEWEAEKEREEFGRAAKLYKPLSGMMAMRFTTGTQQDDDTKADVKVEEKIDKCEATKAAEMKMFGKLTREVMEWHPDRLVCKRFNIPDPYPGSSIVGLPTLKRDKFSVFNFLSVPSQAETSQQQLLPLPESSERSSGSRQTVSQNDSDKPDNKVEKELNKSKNMKSIFSHLMETENQTQKEAKNLSFTVKSVKPNKPKEFKSIFSHLEDSDEIPKKKPSLMETDETEQKSDRVKGASEIGSQKKEPDQASSSLQKASEEEKQETDLFRAIFRNTDSEDSSSSDDEEKSEIEKDQTSDRSFITMATAEEEMASQKDEADEPKAESSTLPGSGEPIPSLEQRLSPSIEQDESDDEYGPALPPAVPAQNNSGSSNTAKKLSEGYIDLTETIPPSHTYVDLTKSSSSKKHKHKHKQKAKKDKKEKHKKSSKHKKKQKKKEKKKRDRREKSSSDSDDTSGKDTDSDDSGAEVPCDTDILRKMKSLLPGQRLRASDFM